MLFQWHSPTLAIHACKKHVRIIDPNKIKLSHLSKRSQKFKCFSIENSANYVAYVAKYKLKFIQ